MAEFHTNTGNEDLRAAIQDRWQYVALIDDAGNEEVRIDIAGDARAEWVDAPASNPMTLEVEVSGGDADVTTPVTLVRSELYLSDSATDSLSGDDFDEGEASLGGDSDTLTVSHDVQQPEV